VAVVIGLVLTLAITTVLMRQEAARRSTTSVNEIAIGGGYLSYLLDRSVRSAGSGFTERWTQSFGCRLGVARNGAQLLPRAGAFPAPFAAVPGTLRLAPLLVFAGAAPNGSDVIALASGASGLGEVQLRVLPGSAAADALRVPATVGLRGGDLVLVTQGGANCLLQQVQPGFSGGADQNLPFGGLYAAASVAGVDLASMGAATTAWVAPLGNLQGNRPDFQLIGVGENDTLFSYDLLQLAGNDLPLAIEEGVVELRARYAVDTNDDGLIDDWVDPAVAPWNAATLLDGTAGSQRNLRRILAVRIGLVMRNSVAERDAVSPAAITLFQDLGALAVTRQIPEAQRTLRYRALEFTVPLRNLLLAPQT
jgi:type IV pilus assembly protein PilW